MLRGPAKVCVRARIGRDGQIGLKASAAGNRVAAKMSAGMLLLTASAAVAEPTAHGTIRGDVPGALSETVVATGNDGTIYRTKIRSDGTFKIKHVRPGAYRLTIESDCDDEEEAPSITVGAGETITAPSIKYECVIVGMISLDPKIG